MSLENEKQKIIEYNLNLNRKYESDLIVNEESYKMMLEEWENKKKDFLNEQETLKEMHKNYLKCDRDAIQHVSNIILSNSEYHDTFPQEFDLNIILRIKF